MPSIRGARADRMILDEMPAQMLTAEQAVVYIAAVDPAKTKQDLATFLKVDDGRILVPPDWHTIGTMTIPWSFSNGQEKPMATAPSMKWYEALADVIATTVLDPYERREVAFRMATVLAEVPKFNRQRFIAACSPEGVPAVTVHVLADRRRIIEALDAISDDELELGGIPYLMGRAVEIVDDIGFIPDEEI